MGQPGRHCGTNVRQPRLIKVPVVRRDRAPLPDDKQEHITVVDQTDVIPGYRGYHRKRRVIAGVLIS